LRQTSVHEPRSSCDGNQFEETWNLESDIVEYSNQEQTKKFSEFILPLKISNLNIIQAIAEDTEEHIHAHTVVNHKYPSNSNHAEHIICTSSTLSTRTS
jgi:hypothetical protein